MSVLPTASSEVVSEKWKYSGIGGWLILVTIGLCASPLAQLVFIFTTLVPIFTSETWSALTTPGTAAYHSLWAPVILLELVMNCLFIAMEAILLFWLFRKSRRFPKAMIAYLFVVFAFVALDYFLAQRIPGVDDPESRGTFVRSGAALAIWGSYFNVSKRVKATFVN